MKLLLDQNISRKLVRDLKGLFPGSSHVFLIGLHESSDDRVWEYAREHGFTIVTQDSDFSERSTLYGYPPKIIWIRTGNTSTLHILTLIKDHGREIKIFEKDKAGGCLQIFSL